MKKIICLTVLLSTLSTPRAFADAKANGDSAYINHDISTRISLGSGFDAQTGKLSRRVTDLVVAGGVGRDPLRLERIYASDVQGVEGNYSGWRFNFQWQAAWRMITHDMGDTGAWYETFIEVIYPDGRVERALENYFNRTKFSKSRYYKAYRPGEAYPHRFTIHSPDGSVTTMGSNVDDGEYPIGYRLLWTTDAHGLRTDYRYGLVGGRELLTRIEDSSGRWIELSYGLNYGTMVLPYITRAVASDGQWVDYEWVSLQNDSPTFKRLSATRYSDGSSAQYSYEFPPDERHYTFSDVRAPSGMPSVKYRCGWRGPYFDFVLLEEINAATGTVVARRDQDFGQYPNPVIITRADGRNRRFFIHMPSTENDVPSQLWDFNGRVTKYWMNTWGDLTRIQDSRGHSTYYQCEPQFGQITRITAPDGSVRTWDYNDVTFPCYVVRTTDELGRQTVYSRLASGLISQVTYPDGSTEGWSYNQFNQATTHRLKNGAHEWFDYDGTGRLLRHWLPSFNGQQHSVVYTYYPDGHAWEDRVQTQTDPSGRTTTYEYDLRFVNGVQGAEACPGRGLVTKVINSDGSYRSFGYDVYGHKIWDENELRQRTSHEYDTYGRLVSTTDPLGRRTSTSYAVPSTLTAASAIVLPSGRQTQFAYDGNLYKIEEIAAPGTGDEAHSWFEYDPVGNLTRFTQQAGGANRVTTFEYDSRGRKIAEHQPLGRTTRWEYDPIGNNTRTVNPDATDTRKSYDAMSRTLTAVDEMGHTTTYAYWPSGQIRYITDPRGFTYEHLYDASDSLIERKYPTASGAGFGSSERSEYNPDGTVAALYNRSGQKLNYSYDNRRREVRRWWDGNVAPEVSTSYDAAGRVTQRANPNSTLSYSYDAVGQLIEERQAIAGGPASTFTFAYDADGNRIRLRKE